MLSIQKSELEGKMAVRAIDLEKGEYYQIGEPMTGILRLEQIDVPKARIYGEFMDINSGGVKTMPVKLDEIKAKASDDRVWYYRKQAIKRLDVVAAECRPAMLGFLFGS